MDYFAFLQEKFEPPTFTDFSKISTPYKYGSSCYVENYARKHVEKLSYQILNEFNSISTRKHQRQYRLYQRCLISNHKDIISQVHDFKSLKDTGTSDLLYPSVIWNLAPYIFSYLFIQHQYLIFLDNHVNHKYYKPQLDTSDIKKESITGTGRKTSDLRGWHSFSLFLFLNRLTLAIV